MDLNYSLGRTQERAERGIREKDWVINYSGFGPSLWALTRVNGLPWEALKTEEFGGVLFQRGKEGRKEKLFKEGRGFGRKGPKGRLPRELATLGKGTLYFFTKLGDLIILIGDFRRVLTF